MQYLLRLADGRRDAGRAAQAAKAYAAVLRLDPGHTAIRVQLGNMLKDSGQYTEAEAAYRLALAGADEADTHVQLGHLLKTVGRRDEALAAYRCALALDPTCDSAVQELAQAGAPDAQRHRFDVEVRAGGTEALLKLSHVIDGMRIELDRLSRLLPEARTRTAFPVALYSAYRDMFPVPPAPPSPATSFHVVLLAGRERLDTLFAQINAIQAQAWDGWTLAVLGHDPSHQRIVELAATSDRRITWVATPPRGNLAAQEHHWATRATGWLLLLAPGAQLDPQALGWFAAAIGWSEADAFVCDEDVGVRDRGRVAHSEPVLRQVVDPDTLLEANVFGETVVVRAETYVAVSPPGATMPMGAARLALLQALCTVGAVGHVPHPLVWRAADGHTRAETDAGASHVPVVDAGAGVSSTLACLPAGGAGLARIAVIIPTRDNAIDLRVMVDSLRAIAADPALLDVVIINNGTVAAADLSQVDDLAAGGARVLSMDGPFNWSDMNNRAVAQTTAPILVFANDDMRMTTPGWDDRLRALLARPGVGAVGARLLYGDGSIQHAGVLFGWQGSVVHDGLHAPGDAPGPARRWQVTRAVGAVTGAFLATPRTYFVSQGGFDAVALPVAYSDIDYALKLRRNGLRVLWTPDITLFHHESKSRGMDHTDPWRAARNAQERAVMEARWGAALEVDPGINPAWHDATLPFRLLTSPSLERVRAHVIRTGSPLPWQC